MAASRPQAVGRRWCGQRFEAHGDGVDPLLKTVAHANGGFLTTGQLNECGMSTAAIAQAVRAGVLAKIRHGYYASGADHTAMDSVERFAVAGRAVLHKLGDCAALCGISAAVEHGWDVWGADLTRVEVVRLDGGAGRREAGVRHHVRRHSDDAVIERGGRLLTDPARTLWEIACCCPVEVSLVTLDSALRAGDVTKEQLEASAAVYDQWPGSGRGRLAIRLSDGGAESVGETRCRYFFFRFAIPAPILQYVVLDAAGTPIARTDFGWLDHGHVGEFDGMVKYSRYVRPGETPFDVLSREKLREDAVRATGKGMSRFVWPDLTGPAAEARARRLTSELDRSRSLYMRNRTVIAL